MSYMLSVIVNASVELAQVSDRLAALAALGLLEDVSMCMIPEHEEEAVSVSVATGTGPGVVSLPATTRRRQRAPANEDNHKAGASAPDSSLALVAARASDAAGASHAIGVPAAVTVGASEGSAPLAAGATSSAGPSPNVTIETVRAYCTKAVQADGSRRADLNRLLAVFGGDAISKLPADALAGFYAAAREEFGDV